MSLVTTQLVADGIQMEHTMEEKTWVRPNSFIPDTVV